MSQFGNPGSVATPQPLYARFVKDGFTIPFTPSSGTDYGAGVGAGVPFGGVVVIAGLVGIAKVPIPAGVTGALDITGTFEITKAASDGGMPQGAIAYWDTVTHVATVNASDVSGVNLPILGRVDTAALTADTLVRITLPWAAGIGAATPVATQTVAAAGSGQSTGVPLIIGMNAITGADGTKGAALPATPVPGTIVIVKSVTGGAVLKVYPDPAATINAISSNGAISMASLTCCLFIATSATQWYTAPLLPS